MSQMQLLDEEFRIKTAGQRKEIDDRHKHRRQQREAAAALDHVDKVAQGTPELIHEYFEHMAKTQPTFDELKKLDAAYANRYNQADQLSDDFNSVYHDDSELKKTSAKAKSAKFGVDDDRPPQDSVFASEEYSHAATYLEVG
ncbi:hypothetical protein DYB30_011916 [Aphanomyces astaci]|uniref:Uncharacterized protein n=1 Tax=Aphanomyces astaci TaxID=112090 RepID=A0A397CJW5_APHAT|nr:hypothetical protein DYB30_011916 [Aphanomyces astaci]